MGFSTHVSILPVKQKPPNVAGNVFIVGGEPKVVVRWTDDQQLNIFPRDFATVFEQLLVFSGVRVNYL